MIGGWDFFCKIALRWMLLDLIDDKSTLVQVMAWCRQAKSHYLSQCWPRSMSPYGNIRPQWFKFMSMSTSCKIAHMWMPQNHTKSKFTLVQVMAWCCQATSHFLNQCWTRSLMPYGITRPQWVKSICRNWRNQLVTPNHQTSNGSWCIGIKGEMSSTVCVTFTWDIYIYMSCL